jgi:hypothetical protein
MPQNLTISTSIAVGDFYEDCAYHPCVCVESDGENDTICGISLVDGSYPRSCSFVHCGVRKLTLEEALHWKFFGPPGIELEASLDWSNYIPSDKWTESYRLPTRPVAES